MYLFLLGWFPFCWGVFVVVVFELLFVLCDLLCVFLFWGGVACCYSCYMFFVCLGVNCV